MRSARSFAIAASIAAPLAVASSAGAQTDAGRDDVGTLIQQLDTEQAALSTADCNAACRALGSIRRAAEKICALEPGPRCEAARSKAADATRRVREACPECVIPGAAPEPERAAQAAEAPTGTAKSESAPPGGCRSCDVTDHDPGGPLGTLGLVIGVALALRRKRHCCSKR